jgi:DnaJ-class molecular chaperone
MTTDNVDGALDGTGLYGVADEFPYMRLCPVCDGEGKAFANRFAGFKTMCRECQGLGEVECE